MTEIESARIHHHKHTVYASFKDHMERCANIFGVPQYKREAYFKYLTDSLERVHANNTTVQNVHEDEKNKQH